MVHFFTSCLIYALCVFTFFAEVDLPTVEKPVLISWSEKLSEVDSCSFGFGFANKMLDVPALVRKRYVMQ